jgi:hypothetical protein
MNNSQIKYVKEKLAQILKDKVSAIADRYEVKRMTVEEKLSALKAGEFLIKEPSASYYRDNWSSWVVFNEPKVATKARDAEIELVNRRYTEVMDEIMLGEDAAALDRPHNLLYFYGA